VPGKKLLAQAESSLECALECPEYMSPEIKETEKSMAKEYLLILIKQYIANPLLEFSEITTAAWKVFNPNKKVEVNNLETASNLFGRNSGAISKISQESGAKLEKKNQQVNFSSSDAYIHVWIKTHYGQEHPIDTATTHTVDEFKKLCSERIGVPAEFQRLTYKGRSMESDRTLADYDIQPESEINLFYTLR
jgi:hypothetical protein